MTVNAPEINFKRKVDREKEHERRTKESGGDAETLVKSPVTAMTVPENNLD